MRQFKAVFALVAISISSWVSALPKYVEESTVSGWSVSSAGEGLAWVKAQAHNPAAMVLQCIVDPSSHSRVATINVHFDKPYTKDAKLMTFEKGVETLLFKPTRKQGVYTLEPLQLGINMLLGSSDSSIFPVLVAQGEKKDFYSFSMENASDSVKKIVKSCGASK